MKSNRTCRIRRPRPSPPTPASGPALIWSPRRDTDAQKYRRLISRLMRWLQENPKNLVPSALEDALQDRASTLGQQWSGFLRRLRRRVTREVSIRYAVLVTPADLHGRAPHRQFKWLEKIAGSNGGYAFGWKDMRGRLGAVGATCERGALASAAFVRDQLPELYWSLTTAPL